MKIKKPQDLFIVKDIFLSKKMNVRHPMGVLLSYSIKNIFL